MQQALIGLGRFGAFWSGVISSAGPVVGWNRSERPLPPGISRLDLEKLPNYSTVWLCNAISAMDEVCKTLAPKLGEKTLVLDTCSVKVHPVKTMLEYFSPSTEILATHPMFGPDSASKGLANLAMVLCPVRVSEEKLAFWYDYFTNLGLRVIVMSPEEHDLAAARTQGVTHFVGRFLAELGLNESPISTLGYRKIKEVMEQTCNDPWQLFLDLQNYNPYGASVRKDMRAAFDRVFEKAGFIDQAERL